MDRAPQPRNASPNDLPRIIIETDKEAADMVDAARKQPYIFWGLGPDVYLGLNPPFTVGTHVSESAILSWAQEAATDPTAAGYLDQLGIEHQGSLQPA